MDSDTICPALAENFDTFLNKVVNHKVTEQDVERAKAYGWKLPETEGTDCAYEEFAQDNLDEILATERAERVRKTSESVKNIHGVNYEFKQYTPEEEKALAKQLMQRHAKNPIRLEPLKIDNAPDTKKLLKAWDGILNEERKQNDLKEFSTLACLAGLANPIAKESAAHCVCEEQEPQKQKQSAKFKKLLVCHVKCGDSTLGYSEAAFEAGIALLKKTNLCLSQLSDEIGLVFVPSLCETQLEICNLE